MKLSVAIAGAEAMPNAFVVFRGLPQSIRLAHEIGYDGVELALKRPDEITRSELKGLLKENHMQVSAVSSGQVFAARNLFFTEEDKEKRAELYSTFCGFIDLAGDFGQLVNIGRTRGSISGRDPMLCEQLFLDMAGSLSEYAQTKGVELILEPVNRYEIDFINNLDACVSLVKKVNKNNFTMMPDVFHMNIEDDHIGKSLIRNSEFVRYIHFADSNRHAPGDGHMPWDEIFDALSSIGYDGWTTVEILPFPDPETAARRSVAFLRENYGSYYC
ncbi:sugar phosphate isomerase/epimerase [Sphaerochaeta pleomorpha str. Grapes]|uniref:Sugar phosphate isomerase/epimerase n=1 Tax=Sphaerochaeta pleomorpha (strain ATCC BAA-1885 / DSM 22778 / Grapes) TaxID=158190 RepID=G8QQG0_SPHPG|nr:sugar phosphate isomerase/epimerase family protein [Sphaerochaeta pleomorpha]AEV29805.1 sugar phosphate isomerase/epimerase [Sphaerochaeta pleomorpha str. Grapes]